jgi:Flp pilus assembly protein TadG
LTARGRARHRARYRGAVTLETLIAVIPFLTFFFTCVQLAQLFTADLVVKHATMCATRAAVVVLNEDETNPGDNGPDSDVVNAAALALGPWLTDGHLQDVSVTWKDASSRSDPSGKVSVTVTGAFQCRVPLGNVLVCGGTSRRLTFTATLPHQGAKYKT